MKTKTQIVKLSTAVFLAIATTCASAVDPLHLNANQSMDIDLSNQSTTRVSFGAQKYLRFDFSQPNIRNIHIVVDMPDQNTLNYVYSTLGSLGYIKNYSKNPSGRLELESLYQYAVDTGLLVDNKDTISTQLFGVLPFSYNTQFAATAEVVADNVVSAKATSDCHNALASCIGTLVATDLECAATVETGVPLLAAACLAGVSSLVGDCGSAKTACKSSNRFQTTNAGFASKNIYFESDVTKLYCDGSNRVDKIEVGYKAHPDHGNYAMVNRLKITCTDGAVKNFGSTTQSTVSSSCGNSPHNLSQGWRVRYSNDYQGAVSAIGLICDRTFDLTETDTLNELKGGTRGALTSYKCAEGNYVVGFEAVLDPKGFITALGTTCRKTLTP